MTRPQLIIVGGGLSGCLAALALGQRRPELSFLLIEEGLSFGGNHIWSFFDSDIAAEDRWLLDPLLAKRWPEHEVYFPNRSRRIELGHNSISSQALHRAMQRILRPEQYRLGCGVQGVGVDHVFLAGGGRIAADAVIDARGPGRWAGLDLGWQKFVGRTYRFEAPHGFQYPVIMDARVDQRSGYRFVYTLPFTDTDLMVEDTYYSTSAVLDVPAVGREVDGYVGKAGLPHANLRGEETGVLPVVLGGSLSALWPSLEPPVARLGLRGGFFHPTTGYSLPDAVSNALLLARQADMSSRALHLLFKERARRLWDERGFYRMLNRMLFHAAEPSRRYRVLEHFYRLPEPLIARFYAGRLTALDKARILSGRPPVPVGRALAAIRARQA